MNPLLSNEDITEYHDLDAGPPNTMPHLLTDQEFMEDVWDVFDGHQVLFIFIIGAQINA